MDVITARMLGDIEEEQIVRGVRTIMRMAYDLSYKRGWYHNPDTGELLDRNFGETIALIHSEISEALEAHRKDAMDDKLPHRKGIEVELADAMLRICDLAQRLNLDLPGAIIEKHRFNERREDHDPANRRKEGGKKY